MRPRLLRRFRFAWRRPREIQADIDAEMRFHLEMRTQELVDAGRGPAEAQAEARRGFGDLARTTRYCQMVDGRAARRVRWGTWLEEGVQDLRYGLRMALRAPGFTAAAVLTIALGIGATTAIFTVVNAVLLRPLPYAGAERLTALFETTLPRTTGQQPTSPANFLDWRERSRTLGEMTAANIWMPSSTGGARPDRLSALRAMADLFALLDESPELGRALEPGDFIDGQDRVALLSHGLWQRAFGGDPAAVGRTMRLDDEPYVIVGVMPPGFAFPPFWARGVELWAPLVFRESATLARASSRDARFLRAFARLRDGVTLEEARAEMQAIGTALAEAYPDDNQGIGVNLQPLYEPVVGRVRPALLTLLAAVALVLLIACANVSNLLLSRGTVRRQEFALRSALGAGRGRLIRQLLVESLLIAGAGGGLGIALAARGVEALLALAPDQIPRLEGVALDLPVIVVAVTLTVGCALGVGLVPAWRTARAAAGDGTRATSSRERQRLQHGLVVGQLAVALMLLVAAALLVSSFDRMQRVDPGFVADGMLTLSVRLGASIDTPDRQQALLGRIVDRVDAVPGVTAAGFVHILHLGGDTWTNAIVLDGRPPADTVAASVRTVTPALFAALGTSLRRGRPFDARDRSTGEPVAIVNETFARRVWPEEDPVGQRVRREEDTAPWRTVVGVVGDVHQDSITSPVRPEIYFPYAQNPFAWSRGTTLVVRGAIRQPGFVERVRRAVWSVGPDLPLTRIRTGVQLLDAAVARTRFTTLLLVLFAGAALALAVIGIHGVIAFGVRSRTREFGIRVAVGATRPQVLALVVRQGVGLAVIGIVLGLAGALVGSRTLESLLFGVTSTDPTTFVGISLLLLLAATAGCVLAAHPATRVEPADALRHE